MVGVVFAEEILTPELFEEAAPLTVKHREEIALVSEDTILDPPLDLYLDIQKLGRLKVLTARSDGLLVGYAVYFVDKNLHYPSLIVAEQDVLFILKEYRLGAVGSSFIQYIEDTLRKSGVGKVSQRVKPTKRDFSPILRRKGYKMEEVVYTKELK